MLFKSNEKKNKKTQAKREYNSLDSIRGLIASNSEDLFAFAELDMISSLGLEESEEYNN